MLLDIATEVAEERQAAGIKDKWPDGMDLESASEPDEFPKPVWAKAQSRFDAMPVDVREAERARKQAMADQFMTDVKEEVTSEVFLSRSAGGMIWMIVFSVVAVGVSFSIGSGSAGVKEALGME
jgi:hypothetical protein